MHTDFEVVLPLRVSPQPSPGIISGGDCGACVLAGLFGVSVEVAYDEYIEERRELAEGTLCSAISKAESEGLVDRCLLASPFWIERIHSPLSAFGVLGVRMALQYSHYVLMALDANYYGICTVREGRLDEKSEQRGDTNHWVLICGYRERWIDLGKGVRRCDQEILISCSATNPDGYWIGVRKFLATKGGFMIKTVRVTAKNGVL